MEYLTEVSTKLDVVLRSVLTKVVMKDSAIFLQRPDELDQWYLGLTLS
jgi:hypothetical protein